MSVFEDSSIPASATATARANVSAKPSERSSQAKQNDQDWVAIASTFATTLSIFGIFLIQGIVIAWILKPTGRGEFGTAMFFPRDVFLYAGLLGGIEIVNRYAVRPLVDERSLKFSAARLGLISGLITSVVAAVVAVTVMLAVGKAYLIPFCLLCCLFVPFEHMQLTISAVDRGTRNFTFYNVNRFIFAATFLALLGVVFGFGWQDLVGLSNLTVVCILFVLARVVGILPTLRGMNVWSTLMAKQTNRDPNLESRTDAEVNVPGALELLRQGRFYALSMLASEMFERLDVFLVVAIATVTESGYYFVAVPAAQLLTVAPNALGVFTFNAGAEKSRLPSRRKIVTVMVGIILLQVVSAFVLAMLIPFLIMTFFGNVFEPSIGFAIWLIPAYAIKGYLQAADGYLKGRNKPMIGVWARMLSILFMLGFVGAVYGGLVGGFEQRLYSIPIAALIGQAVSMILISVAVLKDAATTELDSAPEVSNVGS